MYVTSLHFPKTNFRTFTFTHNSHTVREQEINSKLLSRVAEGTSEVDDSQIDVSTHNITTKDDVAKLFLTIVPHALPSVVDQSTVVVFSNRFRHIYLEF
jgi:hypothetical protein